MGMMDRFLNIMRLNDEYDEDYDEEEEYEEEKPVRKTASKKSREDYSEEEEDEEPVRTTSKVRPMRTNGKVVPMRTVSSNHSEVCVIKPRTVEDGREISDTLLSGRAVVLNLEGLQVSIAQRIIDFASGACYSINGNLQKISNYIFIITPESVDISGDFQEILSSSKAANEDQGSYNIAFHAE